jgi:hypothetical protein
MSNPERPVDLESVGGWISLEAARRRVEDAVGHPGVGLHEFHGALVARTISTRMVRLNATEKLYYAKQKVPSDHWDQLLLATDDGLAPMHSDDERVYQAWLPDVVAFLSPPTHSASVDQGAARQPPWLVLCQQHPGVWVVRHALKQRFPGKTMDEIRTEVSQLRSRKSTYQDIANELPRAMWNVINSTNEAVMVMDALKTLARSDL